MKEKKFLVCDTETTGIAPNNIVFDFAYVIATRNRTVLERSFLVREVLTNPRLMLGALTNKDWRDMFGGKLFRHYIPQLHHGHLSLYSWRDVVETMREDMFTHNVAVFSAYNINFDMRAIVKTHGRVIGSGKVLTYKPDLLDLWLFASTTALNSPLYHDIAQARGWVSEAGNVRTTAEKAYAFLTGDLDFIESHTALEDAQIETEILQRLLAKKKLIPYNEIQHMPWQHAQRKRGKLF
jgi:hypothetical protein